MRGRDAVQRPQRLAPLGGVRRLHRLVERLEGERVEPWVALLDRPQRRVHHLDGRYLALADASGKLDPRADHVRSLPECC